MAGFFSAAETALTAASRAKIHQLAKEGDERAKYAQELQNEMGLTISALLMGVTIFNTVSVALATALLVSIFGSEGVAYASFIMGGLIMIYAEVAPKIWVVQNPEPFLLSVAKVLSILFRILRPILKLINAVARLSLLLVGVKAYGNADSHATLEELRGVIDLHKGPGDDTADERAMLKSILELGSVQIEEIMTHRKSITMVDADEPIDRIVEHVLESPFTRIPLWKNDPDNIIGVINTKALLRAVKAHPEGLKNFDITSVAIKPWFVPENTDLLDQLKAFRERREHFALVVDEYGALRGMVTLEDILEEIVGEISDEHDITVRGVSPQADGSFMIDGHVTIRDLNREFDWTLPDDTASTLAGLVLFEIRRIPDVSQVFILHGFRFEILRRQRNQITLIRVTPPVMHPIISM